MSGERTGKSLPTYRKEEYEGINLGNGSYADLTYVDANERKLQIKKIGKQNNMSFHMATVGLTEELQTVVMVEDVGERTIPNKGIIFYGSNVVEVRGFDLEKDKWLIEIGGSGIMTLE